MTTDSPLHDAHANAGASFLPWGGGEDAPRVVETFGELEIEYAAFRKACAILDEPQRGTIAVRGDDRLEFLDRMLTQAIAPLEPGSSANAFWINRQGRILADLRLISLPDELLLDLDVLTAPSAVESLEAFLFSEDVSLQDVSDTRRRFSIHGPTAKDVLGACVSEADRETLAGLVVNECAVLTIGDRPIAVDRRDTAGAVGLALTCAHDDLRAITQTIVETANDAVRWAGWHAWNIARIEAGTPLFNLDFGPDSLPAETGVLHDRVSFTKGCYPGQEIVARLHSRGNPKQTLVGLRVDGAGPEPEWQPMTGAAVTQPDGGSLVGQITSSTRSPMLSDAVVCFAAVKWDAAQTGAEVDVATARGTARATVQQGLRFWPR